MFWNHVFVMLFRTAYVDGPLPARVF